MMAFSPTYNWGETWRRRDWWWFPIPGGPPGWGQWLPQNKGSCPPPEGHPLPFLRTFWVTLAACDGPACAVSPALPLGGDCWSALAFLVVFNKNKTKNNKINPQKRRNLIWAPLLLFHNFPPLLLIYAPEFFLDNLPYLILLFWQQ